MNTTHREGPRETMHTSLRDAEGPRSTILAAVVIGLLLDAGLSVGAYLLVKGLGYSIFAALLAGMIVAGARAAYVIIRRRTLDTFSLFMIFTFVIGLGLALLGGTPRFLLAKDAIGSAITALVFAATLFSGRPLMYYFSQRFAAPTAEARQRWNLLWETVPSFRRRLLRLTLVWAIAFAAEAVIKLTLIITLPVAVMAPLVPFFTPALITGLLIWTLQTSRVGRQRPQNNESAQLD